MMGSDPSTFAYNNYSINTYLRIIKIRFQGLGVRLIEVKARGKEPIERNWDVNKNYSFNDPRILRHIGSGGNYGLTSIDGSCASVDADAKKIQDALDVKLPLTFRYSTGKDGHFQYWYAIEDPPIGCVPLKDGAYIKGKGGMVVVPGSIHPNGTVYGSREIRNVPIATVTKAQLLDALSEFLVTPSNSDKQKKEAHVTNFQIPRGKEVTTRQVEELISALSETWQKANHMRHVLTLAIIGTCEKCAWDKGSVEKVISGLIQRTGIGHEHLAQVKYAYGRGGRKYGLPTIKKIMEAVEDDNDR